ncbi:MAG TPA: PAS domain-containing protein [Burkholderiales bacterium]|nr:PAS domain-containing protein [Burkholderiales bacterium]
MAVISKLQRPDAAPALGRLLSESALSRAALGACGTPVVMLDATSPTRPITYVNAAFSAYFGWIEGEAIGRTLAALILRGEEAALRNIFADVIARRELKAWTKDGAERYIELTLGPVRDAAGKLTRWVVSFCDRGEVEKLRSELAGLRPR